MGRAKTTPKKKSKGGGKGRSIGLDLVTDKHYLGILVIGRRGYGKTTFLEWLAEQYYEQGALIVDPWSARDQENLYWVIAGPTGKKYPIILVHPEYVEVKVPAHMRQLVKPMCDTEGWERILRTAKKEKRIVCLDNTSYRPNDAFQQCAKLVKQLPNINRTKLHTHIFLCLREAGSLVFSHLKTDKAASATRSAILQMIRESRHNQITWVMDTQRYGDVYKGMRDNTDVTIVKNTPFLGLPEDMKFLWKYVKTIYKKNQRANKVVRWPGISFLKKHEHYRVWASGQVELGESGMPGFRHKGEKDNFPMDSGIEFITEDLDALDEKYGKDDEIGKRGQNHRQALSRIVGLAMRQGLDPVTLCAAAGKKNTDFLRYLKAHSPESFIDDEGNSMKLPKSRRIPAEIQARHAIVPKDDPRPL